MHGIISLLDRETTQLVGEIRQVILTELDLHPATDFLVPHLSWHVAQEYPYQALHQKVEETARSIRPIQIHTTGIGVFRVPVPVLYLAVTVTEELLALHRKIYSFADPLSTQSNGYYSPRIWVPHITLLYQEPKLERYGEIFPLLAPYALERDITINNFAIFCPGSNGEMDICATYFSQNEVNGVA